jgi:hypothetical protein
MDSSPVRARLPQDLPLLTLRAPCSSHAVGSNPQAAGSTHHTHLAPGAIAGCSLPNTRPASRRAVACLSHRGLCRSVSTPLDSRASPAPPLGTLVALVVIGFGSPVAGSAFPTSCLARPACFQARYATDFLFVILNGMVSAAAGLLLPLCRWSQPRVFVVQVSIPFVVVGAAWPVTWRSASCRFGRRQFRHSLGRGVIRPRPLHALRGRGYPPSSLLDLPSLSYPLVRPIDATPPPSPPPPSL